MRVALLACGACSNGGARGWKRRVFFRFPTASAIGRGAGSPRRCTSNESCRGQPFGSLASACAPRRLRPRRPSPECREESPCAAHSRSSLPSVSALGVQRTEHDRSDRSSPSRVSDGSLRRARGGSRREPRALAKCGSEVGVPRLPLGIHRVESRVEAPRTGSRECGSGRRMVQGSRAHGGRR